MANQPSIKEQRKAPAAAVRRPDPFGGTLEGASNMQRMQLERRLDSKIDRYRKEGKDPHDLFDPSKPDYVGKPEAVLPYRYGALKQALQERIRQVRAAAAASVQNSRRQATPAELAGARYALGEGTDHRDVIDRFNAHGIDFSAL
jgi:hypothetical protein